MGQEYIAGVDIGGTNVRVCIADYAKGIIAKVKQDTVKTGDNLALVTQVITLISEASKDAAIATQDISSVGISTCSPFEQQGAYKNVVAPNICGGLSKKGLPNDWTYIPLETGVRRQYADVRIGNDCVSAAVAENIFGAGKGCKNLVYVTWSTGIGAGAIVDGNVIGGKDGNAPHLGHILVTRNNGRPCGCGASGHLEAHAAGPAIEEMYWEHSGRNVSCKDVFCAARTGDNNAKKTIADAAEYFAMGLATMSAIVNNDVYIIGGSVWNDRDLLLPIVLAALKDFSFPTLIKGVEIRNAALEDSLGDIAALSMVMPDAWVERWARNEPWKGAAPSKVA